IYVYTLDIYKYYIDDIMVNLYNL
ncbi:hypothetical protein LCGC14_2913110, partial [marine sediment metagenome]